MREIVLWFVAFNVDLCSHRQERVLKQKSNHFLEHRRKLHDCQVHYLILQ